MHSATGAPAPPGDSGSTANGSSRCSACSARVVDGVATCDVYGGVVSILDPRPSSPPCSRAFHVVSGGQSVSTTDCRGVSSTRHSAA